MPTTPSIASSTSGGTRGAESAPGRTPSRAGWPARPGRLPILAAAAILCGWGPELLGRPGLEAAETSDVEWSVAGTGLEKDPRFNALRRSAALAAREALGRVEDGLGLRPGPAPIHWILDAGLPPDVRPGMDGAAVRAPPVFFEAGRTDIAEGVVRVTLPARKHLSESESLLPVLLHEAAHAVLASLLGTRERYQAVPTWFREGTAVWFAGQGEMRLRDGAADAVFRGHSARSLAAAVSLAGAEPEALAYSGPYLIVRWLEGRLGASGLKALIGEAAAGKDLGGSLRAFLGTPIESCRPAILGWALEEVERVLPARMEGRFRRSLLVRARGDDRAAAGAWTTLLAEDPSGSLAGTLRYLLARDALRASSAPGPRPEAREHLERLLASPSALWRPEALALLGECLEGEGRVAEARAMWTRVWEEFGEDPLPVARARAGLERTARHRLGR